MEKAKRGLKDMSIVILIFAIFDFIKAVVDIFLIEFNPETLPEGATEGVILAARIILCVIGFIVLAPQLYVGIKGIKLSNAPKSGKAHIVWATILAVLAILAVISPIQELINKGDVIGNVNTIANTVLEACIYVLYIGYAKELNKAA